ncbi:MAG: glycosyltransferase family 2 protein, partial [Acidimicrobiales bacterium]
LAAAGIAVLPGLVVSVLFGASYRAAAGIVGLLALESAVLGTIGLLTYLQIARRSLSALWAWVGVGLAVLVISLDHASLLAVVAAMLGACVAVLVLLGIPTLAAVLRASAGEAAVSQQVEVAGEAAGEAELELSLVVPFYNPGPRLRAHVTEAAAVLEGAGVTFEILAVSDGSTDGCEEQLADLFPGVVRTLRLPRNEGKGAALRTGLAIGRGEYLGFIDGDGDIPAGLLSSFIEVARRDRPEVVYGSKRHRDSKVVYPWQRRVYSWGYQSLTRALFSLPVRDTQTGVKLIRRDVVAAVLPRMVEKRFAFDLELLVVARRLGFQNFVELPVVIRERFSSTVSLGSVRDMLLDTAAIFYRLRVLRYYGPPVRRVAPGRLERAAPARDAPAIGHALGSLSLDGSVMKGEQLA